MFSVKVNSTLICDCLINVERLTLANILFKTLLNVDDMFSMKVDSTLICDSLINVSTLTLDNRLFKTFIKC